jgi:hypothetical protein
VDHADESVYLLDMSRCTPQEAITRVLSPTAWTAVDYTVAMGEGVMLFCPPGSEAPPIKLSLDVSGWHHMFVATYKNPMWPDYCLLVKLDSDNGYTRAVPETFRPEKDLADPDMKAGPNDLCEAYWKTANLDHNTLIFDRSRHGSMADSVANIAYIRLVSLS